MLFVLQLVRFSHKTVDAHAKCFCTDLFCFMPCMQNAHRDEDASLNAKSPSTADHTGWACGISQVSVSRNMKIIERAVPHACECARIGHAIR